MEKPDTHKCTLEKDHFYNATDREGVWIILQFREERLLKLNSMERMEEWKILIDMLDSWGRRFCKSFSQLARELEQGPGGYGTPEIPQSHKEYEERKKFYQKWNIENPENKKEHIQRLLAEVKNNLWKIYKLPEIPGLDDKRIGELCELRRELRGYGIEVTDVEALFQNGIKDTAPIKTLLRNFGKLCDTIAASSKEIDIKENRHSKTWGFYHYCMSQGDEIEISKELDDDIRNLYAKVIIQYGEKCSIKNRIEEMKNNIYAPNRGGINRSRVESDCLVQLEYLDYLANMRKIERRLEVRIHPCVKQAKEELINSYKEYKKAEVDFGPEDIEFWRCVYAVDVEALGAGMVELSTGKLARKDKIITSKRR